MPVEFPDAVDVVETLPRDGLQRFDRFVPTDEKVALVELLADTGVAEVEVTSFTHPEMVPNLRDAEEVFAGIDRRDDVVYRALVPNDVGMERAVEAGVDKANALITASPEYNRRNQGMSIEENLDAVADIVDIADDHDVPVDVGIGMSFFSPFEGETPPERTLSIVEGCLDAGVEDVTLATSNGMAHPARVRDLVSAVLDRWPDLDLGMHLHDTNGLSLANAVVAMDLGVTRFDGALCGLGGGVIFDEDLDNIGNTPTEDLVQLLSLCGVETGMDFDRVEDVAHEVRDRLDLPANSHVLKGGTRRALLAAHD
ncbi:MAG: hydroxymethylglutaryl-CoA lyase [Haloferacaceae archaeon]